MLTKDYIRVVTNLLADNSDYTPNYLYVEFTNEELLSIPENDTQGREYYESLSDAGYLRIPITIKPTVFRNKITYTVLASRVSSQNDIPLTDASRIYGVALVSAIDPKDPTRDIVFAREYFDTTDKQLLMDSNQTLCFSFKLAIFDSVAPDSDEYWDEIEEEDVNIP